MALTEIVQSLTAAEWALAEASLGGLERAQAPLARAIELLGGMPGLAGHTVVRARIQNLNLLLGQISEYRLPRASWTIEA